MNRDDALKKIKKCLAVAGSNSPAEAATALRQAQKLMAEHCITERDVSMVDVVEVRVRSASSGRVLWDVALHNLIAEAFGCELFSTLEEEYTKSFNVVRKRYRVFVGIGAAPTVAAYAYEVLSRQCAKARTAHIQLQPRNCKPITKTTRGDEFARGWVMGVRLVVERFAQPAKDAQLLLDYMAAKHGDLKSSKVTDRAKARKVASGHVTRGYQVGKQARLDHGIGQGRAQERLS